MTDAAVSETIRSQEKSTAKLPGQWDYETFKSYLLALSRGKEFRYPIEQMPTEIELSPGWHQVLDKMRDSTAIDGRERWTGIGYKDDRSGIWLRNEALAGANGQIPSYVIDIGKFAERYKGKITGRLGDIHSHPRESHSNKSRPIEKLESIGNGHFSVGDFYTLVYPGSEDSLMGVVDGDENIFAIRTKGSINSAAKTQDQFQEAWYRRNGWKYLGTSTSGESATPMLPTAPSGIDLNAKIAKEYGLALYRGGERQTA